MNLATCPTLQELEAYFDGELSAGRSAEIRAHLANCAACAAEVSRIEATSRLFADAPPVRLSPFSLHRLHANLEATMRQEQEKDRALYRLARICSAVAACIVLVGSLWLMKLQHNSTAQVATAAPPWSDVPVATDSTETASASASTGTATSATGIALAEYYLADASSRDESSN